MLLAQGQRVSVVCVCLISHLFACCFITAKLRVCVYSFACFAYRHMKFKLFTNMTSTVILYNI